jgi:TM2 domain-containing membrane protein YozV
MKINLPIFLIVFVNIIKEIKCNTEQTPKWHSRSCSSLSIGQYKCDKPVINNLTQAAVNCTSQSIVHVPCYPAENIICENKIFDGKSIGFYKQTYCRYVTDYNYQTAVLLSIFLGMFGVDRFYLGYIAFGVIKLCTFGVLFIGYLIDMILIITQTLKPSDNSEYIVDYYGQVLYPSPLYNNNTFNFTFN